MAHIHYFFIFQILKNFAAVWYLLKNESHLITNEAKLESSGFELIPLQCTQNNAV